jgi:ABC-type multidrug transport system permease subunit
MARLREFLREPEAIFWVYGFPIVMMVILAIAFRNQPVEKVTVDIQAGTGAKEAKEALQQRSTEELKFAVQVNDAEAARQRLRTGKTDLVVIVEQQSGRPAYQYRLDKTRAESRLARSAVDAALQQAAGRQDPVPTLADDEVTEPGSRYIDFLVPGLLGMSLMGGGLWGVGFVIVDMRLRKLLKRFLATPMKRSHFLAALILSRLLFTLPEVTLLVIFSHLFFGVTCMGSYWTVALLIVLGSLQFSGLGLLVATRAQTIETVMGLMNAVMMPMWIGSGIFFSIERFPAAVQPWLYVLPLTPLIHAMRRVMLEGAGLVAVAPDLLIVAAWAVGSFVWALKFFRWT